MIKMKKYLLLLFTVFLGLSILAQNQERFVEKEEKPLEQAEEQAPAPSKKPTRTSKPVKANRYNFWDNAQIGGNFGLGFGTVTYVAISPRLYYTVSDKLLVGSGITFNYTKFKDYPSPYDESYVYGFNFFGIYKIFDPIFLQAEYEPLSFERINVDANYYIIGEERVWINNVLLGGGIAQEFGGNSTVFITVLYNVSWSNAQDSYYSSPWVFRIGVGFGF